MVITNQNVAEKTGNGHSNALAFFGPKKSPVWAGVLSGSGLLLQYAKCLSQYFDIVALGNRLPQFFLDVLAVRPSCF
jgi:hypothetical protein